jgi:Holliday junction resolvase
MNSRQKGARGERQWRDELRENGYAARRGQQFSGSPESPDVVCESLPWAHFEVKLVERLNIYEAMEQARNDARGQRPEVGGQQEKIPFVAHRRNHWPWLVTMEAGTFFRLLRGDFQPRMGTDKTGLTEGNKGNEGAAPGFQI